MCSDVAIDLPGNDAPLQSIVRFSAPNPANGPGSFVNSTTNLLGCTG